MYAKTSFPAFESHHKICHKDLIYSCGSCFASEMADRLELLRFQIARHAYGIVYNPLSIAQQFDQLLNQKEFHESDFLIQDGLYHSMDHHGSLSLPDKTQLADQLNARSKEAYAHLKKSSFLVLTLGSSYFFRLKSNQQIVSNCHKISASQFTKTIASLDEINTCLSQTVRQLLNFNPSLQILLSVSPVRYLKEGFIENQRSKSRLLLACEQLCDQFNACSYIPVYEIFMDDLRDYRYVKDDLVHPNSSAIDYIFNYFENAYFNKSTKELTIKIKKWNQLSNHRVMHANSETISEYQIKLEQLNAEIEKELNHFKEK